MPNRLQQLLADFHFVRGMRALRRSNLVNAFAYFQRAIGNNPDNAHYHHGMGICLAMLGDLPEARTSLDQSLRLDPNFEESRQNRGLVALRQGDYTIAIADFTYILDRNMMDYEALLSRAHAYAAAQNIPAAFEDYQRLMSTPLEAAAYSQRGLLHALQGDHDAALADVNYAIDQLPMMGVYYANRAEVHRLNGDFTAALDDYDHAIELDPDLTVALLTAGKVHWQLGDMQAAEMMFSSSISLDTQYADGLAALGALYVAQGDRDKAREEFEDAIAFHPAPNIAHVGLAICDQDAQAYAALVDGNPLYGDRAWLARVHGWNPVLLDQLPTG